MYTYTRVYTYYGTDTEQPTGRIGVHWVCFDTESIRASRFLLPRDDTSTPLISIPSSSILRHPSALNFDAPRGCGCGWIRSKPRENPPVSLRNLNSKIVTPEKNVSRSRKVIDTFVFVGRIRV